MLLLFLISSAFLLPWAGAGRIIGGQEVEPHSRPYMAFVRIKSSNKTSRCGGFLIREDAVLSAAHCVAGKGEVNITVILGAHNIRDQEQSQQRIRARDWAIHPNYSPNGLKNDIVLLKLQRKARINENVQLISIPTRNERVRAGTTCRVTGWGRTAVDGHGSDVLMEVKLKVQNKEPCQQLFGSSFKRQSMICVGDQNGQKSTCKGDSGGPFVCNQKAYGIVSRGRGGRLFPKVFTRVSYFEPWIRDQLRRFAFQELPGSPSSH